MLMPGFTRFKRTISWEHVGRMFWAIRQEHKRSQPYIVPTSIFFTGLPYRYKLFGSGELYRIMTRFTLWKASQPRLTFNTGALVPVANRLLSTHNPHSKAAQSNFVNGFEPFVAAASIIKFKLKMLNYFFSWDHPFNRLSWRLRLRFVKRSFSSSKLPFTACSTNATACRASQHLSYSYGLQRQFSKICSEGVNQTEW
jgi:hypothetical protein